MGSEWGSEPDTFQAGGDGSNAGSEAGEEREKVTYEPDYNANEDDNIYDVSMAQGIAFDDYFEIPLKVSGKDKPDRISKFEECDLDPTLLDNIVNKCKWKKPTPVQTAAIPIVMANRDIMACAQTGSGKTGAFGIPIVNKLLKDGVKGEPIDDGPIMPEALIVAPVRELAQQIQVHMVKLCKNTGIIAEYATGGHAVRHQLDRLFGGCNILVATPGRLNDFIGKNKVSLENLQFLVLDEADRMLDMGFSEIIKGMLDKLPEDSKRTTMMFSATFPDEVQTVAKEMLTDYLFVAVGVVGAATTTVTQNIVEIEKKEKLKYIENLLADVKETGDRTLIFVETKKNADFFAAKFCQKELPATSIHGDRSQQQREEALASFKKGDTPILVATNVAARGLDIPNVQHVINLDLPKDIDEYVHRIGRTGRCGNKGKATSFFCSESDVDMEMAPKLVEILKNAQQVVPDFLLEAVGGGGGGAAAAVEEEDDDEGW